MTFIHGGGIGGSNDTRGVFGGGTPASPYAGTDKLDYVNIASKGNASSFGSLTLARRNIAAFSSTTRVLFGGGTPGISPSPTVNIIDYVTISTIGNAKDFGDLSVTKRLMAGCSSNIRGLFGGGNPNTSAIEYVTIASLGDSIDFGDLTSARFEIASLSSNVRGIWSGGSPSGNGTTIDYVTITSTGNAADFGDSTDSRVALFGCSDSHGGLG